MGRSCMWMAVGVLAVVACGCHPRHEPRIRPPEPLPMGQAVAVVNRNVERITGTLRASGAVDGWFTTPEGRRVHYSARAVLFYLGPRFVRFDLKKLGQRQFLFGSNSHRYWAYSNADESFVCGRHGESEELSADIPVRPDQIPAALGLSPVLRSGEHATAEPVQRVSDEHQQILFLIRDAGGALSIEKEYWLDRYPPHLIRQVVFRDGEGVARMRSLLDDYRSLGATELRLPFEMTADWPDADAHMRLRIRKWELVPQVGPTGPQFATPEECEAAPSG